MLICGSGIEIFSPLLSQLPKNITYIGNTIDTIGKIKNPQQFFSLLSQHNLPYPITSFIPPKTDKNWLFKKELGFGGSHIIPLDHRSSDKDGYFQHCIIGESGSVLFFSNGQNSQLVSINKQTVCNHKTTPFQLAAIETPFAISSKNLQLLQTAINIISQETNLRGLNSLDFIIDDNDQLFILEINPRPSASCELVNDELLFVHHLKACLGTLPKRTWTTSAHSAGLYYLYAPQTLTVPSNMDWPQQSHDLPSAGTLIERHQPICTLIISGIDNEHCRQQQRSLSQKIIQQLVINS